MDSILTSIWWFVAYAFILLAINYCFIMIRKHLKYKKEQFDKSMDEMSKTYIEHEIPFSDGKMLHISWAECVYDIPYVDAVKVFMYYQKLKRKHLNKERKMLSKYINKVNK